MGLESNRRRIGRKLKRTAFRGEVATGMFTPDIDVSYDSELMPRISGIANGPGYSRIPLPHLAAGTGSGIDELGVSENSTALNHINRPLPEYDVR